MGSIQKGSWLFSTYKERYCEEFGYTERDNVVSVTIKGNKGMLKYSFRCGEYREVSNYEIRFRSISDHYSSDGIIVDFITIFSNHPLKDNSIAVTFDDFHYFSKYKLPVKQMESFIRLDNSLNGFIDADQLLFELAEFYERFFEINAFNDGVKPVFSFFLD